MGEKSLVIVESPTKAKTISKYLGKDFIVKASNGHIRDLPNRASEVPKNLSKEKWAKLGVNIAEDFDPLYIIPPGKRDHVKELQDAVKKADILYLATDEDREGESISWHLVETLKPKIPYRRLVFHEITKEAIQQALNTPRDIDENLVRAQETRRIVDRLFGYEVSPLLWKKMSPGLSAGRVQSVSVRLLVERERERIKFRKSVYWGLKANFQKDGIDFEAELVEVDGKRVATGKDFDPSTGKLKSDSAVLMLDGPKAEALRNDVLGKQAVVNAVDEKPFVSKPPAPFVTSTLQQESNRKLRLSAKRTMQVAQQLYENGFITYMRTDSTTLSEQALNAARTLIGRDFGKEFLPPAPRVYQTKVRNAQEAHEAIRPAGESFTPPETVRSQLNDEAFRLYDLIWKRTVASQMMDARGTHITVQIDCGGSRFRASGKTIEFPGFLRAYVEGSDDPEQELADQEKILPKLAPKDSLKTVKVDASEHTTQPPPRFTEGSLIKELERLGIGRPSTWATIVELVLNRSYAFKKGNALVPTFIACAVVGLLENHFNALLDFQFTARLEDDLDAISRGEAGNISYLKSFYFGNGHAGLRPLVEKGEKDIDPRIVCGLPLGTSPDGKAIEVRIGRYGPFISDGETRASVPDMTPPDELTVDAALKLLASAARGPEPLGKHPETGEFVYIKSGRFGPYVQLGENTTDGETKPKMVSLLPNMSAETINLEQALKLLTLPRTLGQHPELKEPVVAAYGRFGPYVHCGKETRTIPADALSPIDISFEQALELLKQPKGQRRASAPKNLREVGAHPVSGAKLNILSGRYGPYVTDGEINASLGKQMDPMTVSLEDCVNLLQARAERIASGEGGPRGRRGKKAKAATPKEPKEKKEKKAKAEKKEAPEKKPNPKKKAAKKVPSGESAVG